MERRKHLRAKPTILKNCVHPLCAASDWCGIGSVDKRAIFQYINQTRYVLFTCIADKKMLWTDDFFGLCLYEGLSDLT